MEVEIKFKCLIPVVDVEFNPTTVRLRSSDAGHDIPSHEFEFTWYRELFNSESPSAEEIEGKQWVIVGNSKAYKPSKDDEGACLRVICKAVEPETGVQLSSEGEVTTDAVITPPVATPRSLIDLNLDTGADFTVLSYNILADRFAASHKFDYCAPWALVWPYRRRRLLEEIIAYNADIICLQEVQSDDFDDIFEPLTNCGYLAVYKKKKNEVLTSRSEQRVTDGCATFFRSDKFTKIKSYELEFAKTAKSIVDSLEETQRREGASRLMKDNVAIVVILEIVGDKDDKRPQHRVCVANTHILANWELPDAKLFQVAQLLKGLQTIAQLQIPVILCGDMNSVPGRFVLYFLSFNDPHKLIVNGKVDLNVRRVDPVNIYRHLDLQHRIFLASAYSCLLDSEHAKEKDKKKMDRNLREPRFTVWNKGSRTTIDYIFYQVGKLAVESLLELFDEEALGNGIPSAYWSSDHIALMAKFKFKHRPMGHYPDPKLPSDLWEQGL